MEGEMYKAELISATAINGKTYDLGEIVTVDEDTLALLIQTNRVKAPSPVAKEAAKPDKK